MADVYPVPCDQVPRPLPTPGTDVDIRNKKKTKTPVITFGLPGYMEPFLGLLFVHKQVQWEAWLKVKAALALTGCRNLPFWLVAATARTFSVIPENSALLITSDLWSSETTQSVVKACATYSFPCHLWSQKHASLPKHILSYRILFTVQTRKFRTAFSLHSSTGSLAQV